MAYFVESTDQRRFPRLPIMECAMIYRDGIASRSVMVDVSLGGAQVQTKEEFEVGDLCNLVIGEGSGSPVSIQVECRHSIKQDTKGLFSVGLRFVPANPEQRRQLAQYLNAVIARDGETLLS